MYRYIAWRLALIGPTVLAASVLVFVVMRVLPGDVVGVIIGDVPVSAEAREALQEELGLNDPLPVQYGRWLGSMVNGEFGGRSLENREPIRSIIGRQLPVTLLLAGYTVLLSILVSVPLGVLAAVWSNRWPDRIIRLATLGGLALPNLWAALLVLLGLLLFFRWSPPIIYTTPWANPWNHVQMLAWPTLILAWEYSSHLVRVTRSGMLEALGQGYITTARSKGLPEHSVILRHALRNALVPTVTMLGLQSGTLLSGVLILETIFGLPGIGRGLVQAALARDYPVIQSFASLLVLLSLAINLVVDMVYTRIDPRISHTTSGRW
ncbi:MAG: ABC transporter permease [Dehalococcoidia bacterium]